MASTSVIDETIHKTNEWLNEMADELGWATDQQSAYQALRAGLHALRDRLTPDEAANLGAQLPMLVRGVYYEGWHPANKPLKVRTRDEYYQYIADALSEVRPVDPENVVRAVFVILNRRVTAGEIDDVKAMLPQELVSLWPPDTAR